MYFPEYSRIIQNMDTTKIVINISIKINWLLWYINYN